MAQRFYSPKESFYCPKKFLRSEDTLQLGAALIQIPLKTPEKLTKMCWFKMRGQGVSGNFEQFLFE
jgi:hypothetical protein